MSSILSAITILGDYFMIIETNREKGRAGLSLAIAYFGSNGYTVSLPINDTQWYDLIIEKDGLLQTVQCKLTATKNSEISLTSKGGTKGKVYDRIISHPVDLLFCADKNKNLFVIPMKDILNSGNQRSIVLRTEHNTNGRGLDTFEYLVHI